MQLGCRFVSDSVQLGCRLVSDSVQLGCRLVGDSVQLGGGLVTSDVVLACCLAFSVQLRCGIQIGVLRGQRLRLLRSCRCVFGSIGLPSSFRLGSKLRPGEIIRRPQDRIHRELVGRRVGLRLRLRLTPTCSVRLDLRLLGGAPILRRSEVARVRFRPGDRGCVTPIGRRGGRGRLDRRQLPTLRRDVARRSRIPIGSGRGVPARASGSFQRQRALDVLLDARDLGVRGDRLEPFHRLRLGSRDGALGTLHCRRSVLQPFHRLVRGALAGELLMPLDGLVALRMRRDGLQALHRRVGGRVFVVERDRLDRRRRMRLERGGAVRRRKSGHRVGVHGLNLLER